MECVGDDNGFEVWRLLGIRYEPQVGMKRLKELFELTTLQNKRCKNPAETATLITEIDRRKRVISDIGGKASDDDVCQNIVWAAMDSTTRAHVTGKLDMNTVGYAELRQVVQSYCNLVSSTSGGGRGGGSTAIDVGAIATVPGTSSGYVISDAAADSHTDSGDQLSPVLWSLDEAGWPVDEEGWAIEGQFVQQPDGRLNFAKCSGKGKGKGCLNCGESGRYAREYVKGNGKADDRVCYNCGKNGHISRICMNPPKGKGKGKTASYGGKTGWSQAWPGPGAIKSLCSLTVVAEKRRHRQRWFRKSG